MKPDISIIIVTYNSANEIGKLLDSIKKSADSLIKESIVIDNSSQDDTAAIVKKHPLKVNFIQSGGNFGFSKAVNIGIKRSAGKYILILNPDTRIIGRCLQFLYDFAEKNTAMGGVAPRLLNLDGKPQPSVFHFPTVLNAIKAYFFNQKEYFGKYLPNKRLQKVDVAVMAALMVPRTALEQVGLLSEDYFMYYEDVEFCRRLKRAHLPVYYYSQAKVEHVHGASGHFKSHLSSPLARSARIYHGELGSVILNLVLWTGQKWQHYKPKHLF